MPSAPNDADEIRRQMALIRHELHDDVREVVASAEAATDWRRYLTRYPLVSLGAAFALGYVLVPRRKPTPATQADVSRLYAAVEEARPTPPRSEPTAPRGTSPTRGPVRVLLGSAASMLAPMAIRFAQGYALKAMEQWMMQRAAAAAGYGPGPVPGPGHDFGGPGESPEAAGQVFPWAQAGPRAQADPRTRRPDVR